MPGTSCTPKTKAKAIAGSGEGTDDDARHAIAKTPGHEEDTSIQIHHQRRPLVPLNDGHAQPRTWMDGIEGNHRGGTRRSQHADNDPPRAEQRQIPEFWLERGRAARMHKWVAAGAKTRSGALARSTRWSAVTIGGEPYPLPSWRIHGHQRDSLQPNEEHQYNLTLHQGRHRRHWRHAAAADTLHLHHSEAHNPSLFPKQRLQEGYGAKGIATAQQC